MTANREELRRALEPTEQQIEAAWKAFGDCPIDLLADGDDEQKKCVIAAVRAALALNEGERKPVVSIMPMALADGRTHYFVSIKVGDREVTPHVFREEYKAAYHVALYDWLLNGNGEEPNCIEFGPDDWPARVCPPNLDGGRPLPFDREHLGRLVREAWVRWANTQPNPKPSWLVAYDELSEADKEADRQIGEAISRWTLIGDSARASLHSPPDTAAWQSIETAPRDYTPILAVEAFTRVDDNDLTYPPEQMVVQWSSTAKRWASFGVIVDSFEPTHWMPLPAAPDTEGR